MGDLFRFMGVTRMGEVIIQDELVEYPGEGVTLKDHVSIPQGVSTCSAVMVIRNGGD